MNNNKGYKFEKKVDINKETRYLESEENSVEVELKGSRKIKGDVTLDVEDGTSVGDIKHDVLVSPSNDEITSSPNDTDQRSSDSVYYNKDGNDSPLKEIGSDESDDIINNKTSSAEKDNKTANNYESKKQQDKIDNKKNDSYSDSDKSIKNNKSDSNETKNRLESSDGNNTPYNRGNDTGESISDRSKAKDSNDSGLDKKRAETRQKDDIKRNNISGNKNGDVSRINNVKNKTRKPSEKHAKDVKKTRKIKNSYNKSKKAAKDTKKTAQTIAKVSKDTINLIKAIGGSSAAVILIIVVVIIVIIGAAIALVPGAYGDYSESESYYSKTDQKTLKKINELVLKYPNADAALAMATVIYPYYNFLWSSDVYKLSSKEYSNELSEERFDEVEEGEDTQDITEEEDKKTDDVYLELLRKYSYRNKLRKLLKQLNNGDENAYFEYLKTDYFKSESAYRSMFSGVSDRSALENAIIDDLKSIKSYFQNYVGKSYSCSVNMQSAGTVEVSDMIKNGNILIDVKEENCTSESLDGCASWHESPITLKEYVKRVTYTEITVDESTSIDKIKTQMIMVKSFVLGRYIEKDWDAPKDESGNYVIPIRANINDQDYCDYNVGCIDKRSGNKHGIASDSIKALLDKAYDETVNEYIYSKDLNRMYAAYSNDYNEFCTKGSCLITPDFDLAISSGLNYQQILTSAFTNSTLINIDTATGVANAQVSGEMVCTELGEGTGVPDDKFVYYSQTDPTWKDTQFCGKSDTNIGKSGCGVTSMAMVISTLSNTTVTPLDTMNEAHELGRCGYDSNGTPIVGTQAGYFTDVAEKYELTVTTLTKDSNGKEKALQTLRNGGLIIANVGSNSPFTTGGHYIVIRRIASGRMVYVGDPNHQELFNTSYSIDDFIDKGWVTNGWWAFIGPKSTEYSTLSGSPGVATGNFVNPFNPTDVTTTYTNQGNAARFPYYNQKNKEGEDICHGAVDIGVPQGTPIFALDGGTVTEVGDYNSNCYHNQGVCNKGWNSYGIYVLIDHGNDYQTVYAHLNQRLVNVGDKVSKGEMIGYSGNTGNSTNAHIHLELRDLSKYSSATRDEAKCSSGKGLMNVTKYINTGISYVGGAE